MLYMSYWIISVVEDNWLVVKEKLIFGCKEEFCTEKIKRGDYIIIYVPSRGCKEYCSCFVGVFEIESNWFESSELLWPDEIKEGKVIYRYRVKLKPVILGKVKVQELIDKLTFIKPELKEKKKWNVYFMGTITNFRRPIPENDAKIIIEVLKKSSTQ